jgi:hypothetical protein
MGVEESIEAQIREVIPDVSITKVVLEGPLIILYTTELDKFVDGELAAKVAKALKRRIAARPDKSSLADTDMAIEAIRHIVPEDAGITNIFFDEVTGEVTIEAEKPGVVIGRGGATLSEIKRKVKWAPKIARTPPIPSRTIDDTRNYLRMVSQERQDLLSKIGARIHRQVETQDDWCRLTFLGGFREVGRSCMLMQTPSSKVLIECGASMSAETLTPYLNLPEVLPLTSIDAVVITHAHLDHCGLVPLLYRYEYDGPVFCTPPTRDLMALLQLDQMRVAAGEGKKIPYEANHVREVVKHSITLNYGETTNITPDIRVTLHNAGHILGSAIAHFHMGEGAYNLAFTGDFKFEKTGLFNPAVCEFPRVETLIIESTYAGKEDFQPSRRDAAEMLGDIVSRVLNKGGKVLIPVFAVGRSQEVMVTLIDLMDRGTIPEVPIYLDGMIWEATAIHTAYPEYLSDKLKGRIFHQGENPFISETSQRVDSSEMRENLLDDPDPCIMLSTSGMLNGGPVLTYLKAWGPNPMNCLVFVGYQAEGTLGRGILKGWREIPFNSGRKPLKIEMDVETVDGFSGHSDRRQLMSYVYQVKPRPQEILTCHGDENKCLELASAVHQKHGIRTLSPKNMETLRLL